MYATHILQFCFYANFAQVELVVIRTKVPEGDFFARVSDSVFWDDKIRVKVLIELVTHFVAAAYLLLRLKVLSSPAEN